MHHNKKIYALIKRNHYYFMVDVKTYCKFYWERQVKEGHIRYYEAIIQSDLFGELVLECCWGRKGTKLGNKKCIAHGGIDKLITEIKKIDNKRVGHKYQLLHFSMKK